MRLVLVGMRGVGKTTLGKKLSCSLNLPFIDTDDALEERWHQPVRDMFLEHGEAVFRLREQEILQAVSGPAIVAVGGGTYLDSCNRKILQSLGYIVCLHLSKQDLLARWPSPPASCTNFDSYYEERSKALSLLSCLWIPASERAYPLLMNLYGE